MLKDSVALLGDIVSPAGPRRDPTSGLREPTVGEWRKRMATAGGDPRLGAQFRFDRLRDNQPLRFAEFVRGLAPSATPTIHYLHLLMPHSPWHYLPSGMRYTDQEGMPGDGGWWSELARQRHELQVGYTDQLLGEVVRTLEEAGLYDESLLLVTADHGLSFTPGAVGRNVDPEHRAAAEVAWVPLFVKAPRQAAGRVDDRNWEHVDLLPTIADYANIKVPWALDGVSALREPRSRSEKVYHNEPSRPFTIDGPTHFDRLRTSSSAIPPLPPPPLPELVGRPVSDLRVSDGGPTATVGNIDSFADVQPATGFLPALVYGTLPASVAEGTPIAIAVNGRIGAVVPALSVDEKYQRFAGLVADETLFVPGPNRVELFRVTGGGTGLQRLRL